MKFLSDVVRYIGVLKVLLGVVKEVKEQVEVFELPGNGEAKKKAIMDILSLAMDTAERVVPGLDLPNDVILDFMDKLIEIVVGFKNIVGEFK